MQKKFINITLLLFLVFLFSCSKSDKDTSELYKKSQTRGEIVARSGTQLPGGSQEQMDTQLKDAQNRLRTGGGLLGKKPTNLIDLVKGDKGSGDVTVGSIGLPINPYLWKGALETIDFMPLSSVDPMSGIIITEWYSDSNSINERCKINIFIKGIELKSNNLKVNVFCQELSAKNTWVNKSQQNENNIKLENAILNKAKKLKIKSLG